MRTAVDLPPTRHDLPGTSIQVMVLAADAHGLLGVEVGSGAPVRARFPEAADTGAMLALRAYDLVVAPIGESAEVPDPCQPEAVDLADLPTLVGHVGGRRAERWIRPLLHPEDSHLLGFAGPCVPFWQLDGSRPSMALVDARPQLAQALSGLHCRFVWRNLVHDLPVEAPPTAIADEPRRVLVTLTPPREGHCYKVVSAVL